MYKCLIKAERFLNVNAMLELTLSGAAANAFSIDGKIIFIFSELIAFPFAIWRAVKCKESLVFKLVPLPEVIKIGMGVPVNVEMVGFSVFRDASNITSFSISNYEEFLAEHYGTGIRGNNVEYLKEYLLANLWKGKKHFWRAIADSISYGGEFASIAGFVMLCLLGIFSLNSPVISFFFSASVFIMGSLLGYEVEKVNNLLLQICFSDLRNEPELWRDICDLSCRFYSSRVTIINIFDKVASFLSTVLLVFMGLMFMGNAPSINDSESGEIPSWYVFFSLVSAITLSFRTISGIDSLQKQELDRTGTKALLERQKTEDAIVKIEEIDAEAGLTGQGEEKDDGSGVFPKQEVLSLEQKVLSPGEYIAKKASPDGSPDSSNSSTASDSPPRSLPSELTVSVEKRPASVGAEELTEHKKKKHGHGRRGHGWSARFLNGRRDDRATDLGTSLLDPSDDPKPKSAVG